ncbi:MAG TPA: ClpXP protease specificity-enhancing factor [Rhodocyclaceae bacterium]|nr:ClpXP protease specificity-enhancing factor [Rhodocyclaceae bacterium]
MSEPASTKPYLIRAIHEWCVDQGFTPYLNVVVDGHTKVPRQYVKDGGIVLNLGPEATHQLVMGNETISFSARFSGVSQALSIPVANVAAIYARENGQGMAFEAAPAESGAEASVATPSAEEPSPEPAPSGRSHLTRIK